MAFPGRYEEKKRPYRLWLFVLSGAALLVWGIWHVAQVMKAPMPKQAPPAAHRVVVTDSPGLVRQTAEGLQQDTKRISKGDVLGASKRKQQPARSAVIYSTNPDTNESDGYYSSR